jgi:hypothetical protein
MTHMRLLKVVVISGSLGAFLATLVTLSVTTEPGTLLTEVAQFLRLQPEPIDKSPAALMQWYHQFDDEAEGQAAAQEQYYDHYVTWELTIDQLEPVGTYVQTISKYPGSPPDDRPPYAVWAFFTDQADIAQLREDHQVAVQGKIVFLNAGNIFLGDCQLLSSREG